MSIDPHCIFGGYTFCQYNYGSAVYFMVGHILQVFHHPSIGMPASEMEHILILFDGCLQLLTGSPTPHPCIKDL